MSPGALIAAARRRHGLSQRQLAVRAGTTQSAISRIERDQVSPRVKTVAGLLALLGEELRIEATPVDHGHDQAMLAANLESSPDARLRRNAAHAGFVRELRGQASR